MTERIDCRPEKFAADEPTAVELCLTHVSPLLDQVVRNIGLFRLHPYEAATVVALAATQLSTATSIAILDAPPTPADLDPAVKARLDDLLVAKVTANDVVLNAAFERFVSQAARQ